MKRTRLLALGVVVLVGIAAVVALATTVFAPASSTSANVPSPTAYIVTGQSSCTATQSDYNCTLVISRSTGQISTADISSVKINGTGAQISGMTATEDSVSLNAGIKLASLSAGINNANNSNLPPVTVGQVVVYLKDGTTVSALVPNQRAE